MSVQGLPANQLRLLRMTPKHGGEQTVAPGHGAVPATSDRWLKRWRWVSPLVGCGTVHGLPANSMHSRKSGMLWFAARPKHSREQLAATGSHCWSGVGLRKTEDWWRAHGRLWGLTVGQKWGFWPWG